MLVLVQAIVVTGIVKGSQAEGAEKDGLQTEFQLTAVGGADAELTPLRPDTYELDCMQILKDCHRPVTLCFREGTGAPAPGTEGLCLVRTCAQQPEKLVRVGPSTAHI